MRLQGLGVAAEWDLPILGVDHLRIPAEPRLALCYALSAFEFMNTRYARYPRDCDAQPGDLPWQGVYLDQPAIVQREGQPYLRLHLATTDVRRNLPLRVRMPRAQRVFYRVGDADWTRVKRGRDYFVWDRFPSSPPLIAEGHSNGAFNIHGLGIFLRTSIDDQAPRAVDPSGTIRNEHYYSLLRWSRESRWSSLIFGPRLGRIATSAGLGCLAQDGSQVCRSGARRMLRRLLPVGVEVAAPEVAAGLLDGDS